MFVAQSRTTLQTWINASKCHHSNIMENDMYFFRTQSETLQVNNNTSHPRRSLSLLSPCYLHHCCEWGNDRAGSWGDNLSGAESNAPHRRPITSNARQRGEDVPDQDRGRVTACFCISGSLADENVYSGGMNQCWGEILIHFHLKFPFKFLYLWVRGRVALWSCTVPQVTLSLKIKFEGRTTASVCGS